MSVRCAGGAAWRGVHVLLPAAAAASVAAWGLGHGGVPEGPRALGVALAAVAAMCLAWWRTPAATVDLVWDGQAWSANGAGGLLDVMLDLGPWMLLRLRPPRGERGRTCWIPCAATETGATWHALRVAAYGRVPGAPAEAADA